jgi:expansin (peptidoglycan-binding protein)
MNLGITLPSGPVLAALVIGCSSGGANPFGDGGAGPSSDTGGSNGKAGSSSSTGGADGKAGAGKGGAGGRTSAGGTRSGAGGMGAAPSATCSAEPKHTGQATYYTSADGSGNCSFDPTPNDLMIGAMNATDYAGSAVCGGCVRLDGPNGSITIRIVDQCPECPKGNIDLSPQAFDHIAARSAGRVPISWEYTACDVSGPLVYRFKEGSSQYWTAVQVRNHRFRIAKFEYQKGGQFVAVPREDYNYFVEASGMGTGPYTFRLTDVYGNAVTDSGIAFEEAAEVSGKAELPVCTP